MYVYIYTHMQYNFKFKLELFFINFNYLLNGPSNNLSITFKMITILNP